MCESFPTSTTEGVAHVNEHPVVQVAVNSKLCVHLSCSVAIQRASPSGQILHFRVGATPGMHPKGP